METLDRIDELLEELHALVQSDQRFGEEEDQKVTDFCEYLSVQVHRKRVRVLFERHKRSRAFLTIPGVQFVEI